MTAIVAVAVVSGLLGLLAGACCAAAGACTDRQIIAEQAEQIESLHQALAAAQADLHVTRASAAWDARSLDHHLDQRRGL